MNISLEELMTNSVVISIDNKRLSDFYDTFKHVLHVKTLPRKYDGVILPNGFFNNLSFIKKSNLINCTLAHIGVITMAKTMGLPYVCVFEDDTIPTHDIKKFNKYLSDIPEKCKVLKLGYSMLNPPQKEINSNYITNETRFSGSYIVFNNYYDTYLTRIYTDLIPDITCINFDDDIYATAEPLFINKPSENKNDLHGIDFTKLLQSFSKDYIRSNFGVVI